MSTRLHRYRELRQGARFGLAHGRVAAAQRLVERNRVQVVDVARVVHRLAARVEIAVQLTAGWKPHLADARTVVRLVAG